MSSKEGELDALKVTSLLLCVCIILTDGAQQMNTELSAQLSSGRKPGGADPMEIRSLTSRATNAERRLNIAQNQLANAEDRLAAVNQRTSAADIKWDARVKEYEDRLKKAEEQYKRERQGSKESQAAYETQIKYVLVNPSTHCIDPCLGHSTDKRSLQRSGISNCKTFSSRRKLTLRRVDQWWKYMPCLIPLCSDDTPVLPSY